MDDGYLQPKLLVMSYKKLLIWQLAREVVIEAHEMSLKLPKFEFMKKAAK